MAELRRRDVLCISSLVSYETHDLQIADPHVILRRPDAEPTLGIRLGINHLKDLVGITPVLDEMPVCDQSDGLHLIRDDPFRWLLGDGEIIIG